MAQADPVSGKWLRVNRKMCEITGYSSEEMLAMPIVEITHPEDRQADREAFLKVMTGKSPDHRIEKRFIRKDGAIVWVNVNLAVIRDDRDQPVRTIAIIEDVTSRKLAEESLRVQEERLRTAMDASRQGWSDFNVQTGEVIVSPEYARMIGYEPSEFTTNLRNWFDSIHPEDRTALREAFGECLETGETRNMEYRRRAKTGDWKWIRSVGKVISFDARNRPLRMIGAHADISRIKQAQAALRESEELYRTLVEASPDSITVTDIHGTLMFSSNKALQLFGHSTDEDLAGRSMLEWVAPEERRRASQDLALLFTEGTLTGREYTLMRKDGALFWGEINAAVFSSPDGNPRGIMIVTRDITEAKRTRDALKESESRFRSYIESAPVAVFVADNQGGLVDFNPTAVNMLGYPPDVLRTLHILDLHPEEDRAEALKAFSTLMETGHVETEFRLKKSNGDVIWVSLHAARPADQFVLGYCQDISERKRAEEALRQSEEKYRSIFDDSVAAIFIFDTAKNFIDSNQTGLDFLGYTREELQRMSTTDVEANPAAVLPAHKQLLSGGRLVNYEHQLRRKDGSIITVLNNSRPTTDSSGNILGVISTLIDITERKQAEKRLIEREKLFSTIVGQAIDAVVLIDPKGRFVEFNEAAHEGLGYSREQFALLTLADIQAQYSPELIRENRKKSLHWAAWNLKRLIDIPTGKFEMPE